MATPKKPRPKGNPRVMFRLEPRHYGNLVARAAELKMNPNSAARFLLLTVLESGAAPAEPTAADAAPGPSSGAGVIPPPADSTGPTDSDLARLLSSRARVPVAFAVREVRAGNVEPLEGGRVKWRGQVYG